MIYINCDTVFRVNGLRDSITEAYVEDAAIVGWLKELDGTAIDHFDFSHLEDGDYYGTLSIAAVANLECGQEYLIDITASRGQQTWGDKQRHLAGYKGDK